MELIWLEDFLALSNTGVFSRAAELRNVTQPAFTRRIKRLEVAVGATLFDRSVHPVVLTEAGKEFLPLARSITQDWGRIRMALSDSAGSSRTIRIATLQSLAVAFLPKLVSDWFGETSGLGFHIMAENYADCIETLMSGNADVMICYSDELSPTSGFIPGEVSIQLSEDRVIPVSATVGARPRFSLDSGTIPYLHYSETSFLGRVTNQLIAGTPEADKLEPVYKDTIAAALKAAVMEGIGVAWLPEKLVQREIETGILKNLAIGRPDLIHPVTICMYRAHEAMNPSVGRFWKSLESAIQDGLLR